MTVRDGAPKTVVERETTKAASIGAFILGVDAEDPELK